MSSARSDPYRFPYRSSFQGRYKAVLVAPEERSYLPIVSDYVHLNPVRAGFLKRGADLAEYRWSCYPWYVGNPRKRPVWLEVQKVLGEFGSEDRSADRRHYAESSQRQALEAARPVSAIRVSPCFLTFVKDAPEFGSFGAGGVWAARSFGSGFWGCSIMSRTAGKRSGLAMRSCGGSTGRREPNGSWYYPWRR